MTMKTSTDRYVIAQWLNFNKYPVLSLDLATTKAKENYLAGCYLGQKVRWLQHSSSGNYYWHGQLCFYKDSGLQIDNDNACITASFGYHDIIEDIANANAPIIEENGEVVIVIHDSEKRLAIVCKTKITGISKFRTPAVSFEDDFKQIIKRLENA